MNASQNKRRTDDATIYLYSKCESLIEIYARSASLPESELRNRVGELLLGKEMREQLGSTNHLPALRRQTPRGNQSVESMEMVVGSHRRAQVKRRYTLSPKAVAARRRAAAHARAFRWPKKKTSMKGFSYEGKHWTQQPENKARLRAVLKARAGRKRRA